MHSDHDWTGFHRWEGNSQKRVFLSPRKKAEKEVGHEVALHFAHQPKPYQQLSFTPAIEIMSLDKTSLPYPMEVIYDGYKNFWRTHTNMAIMMVEHVPMGVIEVIAYEPMLPEEAARIYVDRIYVDLETRIEEELDRRRGHMNHNELCHMILRDFKREYILSRLQMHAGALHRNPPPLSADSTSTTAAPAAQPASGASAPTAELWGVSLVPNFNDTVTPSGDLDVICAPPASLHPALVKHTDVPKAGQWEQTLHDFQELLSSPAASNAATAEHRPDSAHLSPLPPMPLPAVVTTVDTVEIMNHVDASMRFHPPEPIVAPVHAVAEPVPVTRTSMDSTHLTPLVRTHAPDPDHPEHPTILRKHGHHKETSVRHAEHHGSDHEASKRVAHLPELSVRRGSKGSASAPSHQHLEPPLHHATVHTAEQCAPPVGHAADLPAHDCDEDTIVHLKERSGSLTALADVLAEQDGDNIKNHTYFHHSYFDPNNLISPMKQLQMLGRQASNMAANLTVDVKQEPHEDDHAHGSMKSKHAVSSHAASSPAHSPSVRELTNRSTSHAKTIASLTKHDSTGVVKA